MVSNSKIVKSINTYSVVPQILTLTSTPTKLLKKQRKIRGRTQLATIKRAQSDTTASDRFLLAALHSVSHSIIRSHTDKISLYNNTDTAFCADSGASEDMFPDYSAFNTYHQLSNCYAALVDTNRIPIEE